MALTLMWWRASSSASAWVIWTTPRLGNGIGGKIDADAEAEHRGDVDDGARLAGAQHAPGRLLGGEPDRVEIDRHDAAPLIRAELDAALQAAGYAGIVDDQRDGAEGRFGGIEGRGNARPIGDVELDAVAAAAGGSDLAAERFQAVAPAGGHHDGRAMGGKNLGKAPPEARGGTGDQRHFAGQVEQLRCRGDAALHAPSSAATGPIGAGAFLDLASIVEKLCRLKPPHAGPGGGPRVKALLSLSRAIDRLSGWVGQLAAIAMLAACAVSCGNALLRYSLSITSNFWLEIQWYLFGAMFMLGAAYTLKLNEHVRVDLVYGMLKPRTRLIIDILGTLMFLIPTCAVGGWLTFWFFWDFMADRRAGGERRRTAALAGQADVPARLRRSCCCRRSRS